MAVSYKETSHAITDDRGRILGHPVSIETYTYLVVGFKSAPGNQVPTDPICVVANKPGFQPFLFLFRIIF